jgi:altronate dehydratase
MALSASTLASLIKSKVDTIDFDSGAIDNNQVIQKLAEAIVEHITSSAQVVVPSGSSAGTYGVK